MVIKAEQLLLYLVTDPSLCPGPVLLDTVSAAVRGGVTVVQLRDKKASTRQRIDAARSIKAVLHDSGVPLVVNDDVEAAILSDADGVHIGQEDVALRSARARLGPEKIIGLSCETLDQVAHANCQLVDYLGLGTVFQTSTKPDHKATIGISGLAAMAQIAKVPTVAIGGLKHGHARDVIQAGCDGMAVVSAICGQPHPENAARELATALKALKRVI